MKVDFLANILSRNRELFVNCNNNEQQHAAGTKAPILGVWIQEQS